MGHVRTLQTESGKVICTAKVGKQAFLITVEELEPDKRQPAVCTER
jgi:hypothetical protein